MSPAAETINGLLDTLRLEPQATQNGHGVVLWEKERARVIDALIKRLEGL